MSVLIKGMEMPDCGYVCLKVFANGEVLVTKEHRGALVITGIKDKEGTAVSVPPHGRLIEAEPIMKYIADGLNSGEFGYDQIKVLSEIQYAPTIIPAEERPAKDTNVPTGPYDLLYEEGGEDR